MIRPIEPIAGAFWRHRGSHPDAPSQGREAPHNIQRASSSNATEHLGVALQGDRGLQPQRRATFSCPPMRRDSNDAVSRGHTLALAASAYIQRGPLSRVATAASVSAGYAAADNHAGESIPDPTLAKAGVSAAPLRLTAGATPFAPERFRGAGGVPFNSQEARYV